MVKRLFTILGALALIVSVGAIAAPTANAASQECSTHQGSLGNLIDTCSVWNSNYVQGRFLSYPTPSGTYVQYISVTVVYYVNGSQIYSGRMPSSGGYGPTVQIPHGAYFQAAYIGAEVQTLRTPTIRVP